MSTVPELTGGLHRPEPQVRHPQDPAWLLPLEEATEETQTLLRQLGGGCLAQVWETFTGKLNCPKVGLSA